MDGTCSVCGSVGPVERHHIAGRRNGEALTDLCVPNHRDQTSRHLAAGITSDQGEPAPVERVQAMVAGVAALLSARITLVNHMVNSQPDRQTAAPTIHMGELHTRFAALACEITATLMGTPDAPGFRPNPRHIHRKRHAPTSLPVNPLPVAGPLEWLAALARATESGDLMPLLTDAAEHPAEWSRALAAVFTDVGPAHLIGDMTRLVDLTADLAVSLRDRNNPALAGNARELAAAFDTIAGIVDRLTEQFTSEVESGQ